MSCKNIIFLLCCAANFIRQPAYAQLQACPDNINFSAGDLSSWSAQTGLVNGGSQNYPAPNSNVSLISEYSINTTAIDVITTSTADPYGSFPTIPTINGYAYGYSVKLGSTATSYDLNTQDRRPGGFTRSITYMINVPPGLANVPYTMTYAYAMVLENGTHNSDQQPLFKATLSTSNGIIDCASPEYYLPTFNNAGQNGNGQGGGSTGATLDSATAIANGFKVSPVLFLSHSGPNRDAGQLLQDVWTKGWTEVTFDLSPYRGQQVKLTFEADNCVPGAHFAYAYVALRNSCAGLEISGAKAACTNSTFTYSVPALADAVYSWSIPPGWTLNSEANTNTINITAGTNGGSISVREINGCADLKDTIAVTASPPTVAGRLSGDNIVCAGINSTALKLTGAQGNILNWIASADGINWTTINNISNDYVAQNLNATTQYKVVVQNGGGCNIDTSSAATVKVDQPSKAGNLSPSNLSLCIGQDMNNTLKLSRNTGTVLNWQLSNDNNNWQSVSPVHSDSVYAINTVNASTYYRAIVKNGVCAADTSDVAAVDFINAPFPDAVISPADTAICYGEAVQLKATINIGDSYQWSPLYNLKTQSNGSVTSVPADINAIASPTQSTDYLLTINNASCPNALTDTFHINVSPKINVFAGNDTFVVAGQPLQLNAITSDSSANIFSWTPATGLNFTDINNPIATLGSGVGDSFTYLVKATDAAGCYGEDDIKITLFKTGPDILVPSAFTPNSDGINDIIRPICVGISKLLFFRIYNRWGQLIYNTDQIGQGWDGRIKGVQQPTAGFVYMAAGIDYTGKTIFRKGSVILIR